MREQQREERVGEQQSAEQRGERERESRAEAWRKQDEDRGQVRKRPEESWAEARRWPGRSWAGARVRPGEGGAEARWRPEERWAEARRRPEESWARARGGSEYSCIGARKRPETRQAEDEGAEAGWENRHVRERVVQDRLGYRQEGGQGHVPGQEGPKLRPNYRIPRRKQSWRTAEASGGLPLSYEGYIIAAPRDLEESTAFQNLMKKGMLFQAPEAGPGEYYGPHFRFTSGRAVPDRRRGRSPGWQEAAKRRHRD